MSTSAFDNSIYRVVAVTPNLIQIEIHDLDRFRQKDKEKLAIGSYLRISDHDGAQLIAIVQSFKIDVPTPPSPQGVPGAATKFILDAQPVGFVGDDGCFKRGGKQFAIPPQEVIIAPSELLKTLFSGVKEPKAFTFGSLVQDQNVPVIIDGDKFFSKHIAVVGSTGSGKSCTVAKILQNAIEASSIQASKSVLNNAHIIIFDLHGEYTSAFSKKSYLNVKDLVLPYWLMTSEELEDMFVDRGDHNNHNQLSEFKNAVTINKTKHNPSTAGITYDTPVYFSIEEVQRWLHNQNFATKDASTGELAIDQCPPVDNDNYRLFEKVTFKQKVTGKINNGPFVGEFDRFVSRFATKLNDKRLKFLLNPRKSDDTIYTSNDIPSIFAQFIGYREKQEANLTIIDLSGIPFEAVSIVVSLVSRLIFDFCFHYKQSKLDNKDKQSKLDDRELPFLIVYEEAHNYVPRDDHAEYRSVKRAVERVAKEGRKYGISAMIVSQRPSEVSETIFSQCNNFVAMRLTNPADQQYVRRLLPDSVAAITDALPSLEQREAIIIGDSVAVPSLIRVDEVNPKPSSNDVDFRTEWSEDWLDIVVQEVVARMSK
jgi:hypothetical protein